MNWHVAIAEALPVRAGPAVSVGHWASALRDGALLARAPGPLPAAILRCAERMAKLAPQSLFVPVNAGSLAPRMREAWRGLGAAEADAQALTEALAAPLCESLAVLDSDGGRLRLEIVHARTCPKLHVDRLRWRLCCTLHGAGTEYLPPGERPTDPLTTALLTAPTGVLTAMAGALSGPGLWHRSPHACAEHPRVFLSLDVL